MQRRVRWAVLLDMDGTLTRPVLDFARMREEMGIAAGEPILEALAGMVGAARAQAERVLLRHERQAAESAELNEGCVELLEGLRGAGAAVGLVTRNSRDSVDRVLGRFGLRVDAVVSREDVPYKPDPGAVWRAMERLGVRGGIGGKLRGVWMVGDGVHDVEAGLSAGVRTVWVSHGQGRRFAAVPDVEVVDLWEVRRVILSEMEELGDGG